MRGNSEFLTLRDAMDRLLQDSFVRMQPGNGNGNGSSEGRAFVPAADAWESQDEVVVELALPGVNPDEVDITFEQDTLTVTGQLGLTTKPEGQHWILRERPRGTFQRRFSLQVPVDVERVEATYNNGILTLHLPKSEAVKPRKITVKSGQQNQ